MSADRRQAILVGLLVVVLAITTLWSLQWMLHQRTVAQRTRDELGMCRRLAEALRSIEHKPKVAESEAAGVQELGDRIETAMRRAGLDPRALESVRPQSARPVENSPYSRKPTGLTLRSVTLTQLVTFLHSLTDGTGLNVRELRLRAPHGAASDKLWNAEATVTYLVYAASSGGTQER